MSKLKDLVKTRAILQMEISPEKLKDMDELVRICCLTDKQDLINNALSLFDWAIAQIRLGREIAAVEESKETYHCLEMDSLTAAGKSILR